MNPKQKFKRMAAFIKSYRLGMGLSQVAFAKAVGLGDVQYVSNIERGMCGLPSKQIHNVSKALGVPHAIIIDIMVLDHAEYLAGIVANSIVLDRTTTEPVA